MIDGKSILAVITARGGSVSVPKKNIRPLGNKPLIAWTIQASTSSSYVDCTILSSDDDEIISVAKEWGCDAPFKRPAELARDTAKSIDVLLHALNTIEDHYDYVVLLQPTSPFRTAVDIDLCIEACLRAEAPVCVSLSEPSVSPYRMYTCDIDQIIKPILQRPPNPSRRQDLPSAYLLNGAVYVLDTNWFIKHQRIIDSQTVGHMMPDERSIDIDTELDFIVAEGILNAQRDTDAEI